MNASQQSATNARTSGIPRPTRIPVSRPSASQSSLRSKQLTDSRTHDPATTAASAPTCKASVLSSTKPARLLKQNATRLPTASQPRRPNYVGEPGKGSTSATETAGDGAGTLTGTGGAPQSESDADTSQRIKPIMQKVPDAIKVIKKSRPSLSERTMESIAQIPPSPANRRRRSSFFQAESPQSVRSQSAASTSRTSPQEKATVKPLSGGTKIARSGTSLNPSTSKLVQSSAHTISSANLPSNDRRPLTKIKTLAPRLAKASRPPLQGIFNPSNTQPSTADTDLSKLKSLSKPAKSSAALREHIRVAKATRKSLGDTTRTSSMPASVRGPEFESINDPFNQVAKDDKHFLQSRLATARSQGRLNIAGMELKEMPEEVLKLYDYEFSKHQSDIVWSQVVDLCKFNAADNEMESIPDRVFPDIDTLAMGDAANACDDDAPGPQFAGIDHLDLHGNLLSTIPIGLRRLERLTCLNLSRNRLDNTALHTISQVVCLRELKLAENRLSGLLDVSLTALSQLTSLQLQGNQISALPEHLDLLVHLRTLDVSGNALTTLPMTALSKTPLTYLSAGRNRLSGLLYNDDDDDDQHHPLSLPALVHLDLSVNALAGLSSSALHLPSLCDLNIAFNRITSLPSIATWTALISLWAEGNSISQLPDGFVSLSALKVVDFTGNDFNRLDPHIGLMQGLEAFKIAANPIRDRKFLTMDTSEMKRDLRDRLDPDELDAKSH